jgi:hypothetical protein
MDFLSNFLEDLKYNNRLGNAATSIVVSLVIIIGCVGSLAIHQELKSGYIRNLFEYMIK